MAKASSPTVGGDNEVAGWAAGPVEEVIEGRVALGVGLMGRGWLAWRPAPDTMGGVEPTLVIMAAGLGSRFGGVKQLARVGAAGEAILDFSIDDAVASGFERIVVIVRSDIETDVRQHISRRHSNRPDGGAEITYVCQDELGPPRAKPWGTAHAILSAAKAVPGPFAVINADDYYGPSSFRLAADCLAGVAPGQAVNVAFEIGQTVPPAGTVTRGVTQVADGHLVAIVETDGCQRLPDGLISAGGTVVPSDTPVSMNLWCFHHSVLDDLSERWQHFLHRAGADPKAECQLPTVVGELMAEARLVVRVVLSGEQWIGITNPDDLELTRQALAKR
jgi:choline kinase